MSKTRRPVKILHLAATSTGGVGLLLLYLAKNLDKDAFDLSVAFGRGYLLDERFDSEGIEVHDLGTSRRYGPLSIVRGLVRTYKLLRVGDYDIVHSHTSVGGVIGRVCGWLTRTPWVVWTVHGFASHPGHTGIVRSVFTVIERLLDKVTDHYVAVSDDLRVSGIRKRIFTDEKVTVIYNGIDLEELDRRACSGRPRAELGIDEGSIIIGTVTRLEPQKAIDQFLRAMATVSDRCPEARFVIAGDGPFRLEMVELAKDLGIAEKTVFLGWRTDVLTVLRCFDVFCMSSRWEGCPMVLLEAMAMRRPVVSTDVGGIREIVDHEKTGFLVKPDRPKLLAEAAMRLVESEELRRQMGDAGRRRVENQFTLGRMLEDYERFYCNLRDRSLTKGAAFD